MEQWRKVYQRAVEEESDVALRSRRHFQAADALQLRWERTHTASVWGSAITALGAIASAGTLSARVARVGAAVSVAGSLSVFAALATMLTPVDAEHAAIHWQAGADYRALRRKYTDAHRTVLLKPSATAEQANAALNQLAPQKATLDRRYSAYLKQHADESHAAEFNQRQALKAEAWLKARGMTADSVHKHGVPDA